MQYFILFSKVVFIAIFYLRSAILRSDPLSSIQKYIDGTSQRTSWKTIWIAFKLNLRTTLKILTTQNWRSLSLTRIIVNKCTLGICWSTFRFEVNHNVCFIKYFKNWHCNTFFSKCYFNNTIFIVPTMFKGCQKANQGHILLIFSKASLNEFPEFSTSPQ